ncbi:type II toxin-antitoxin system Phd/YefM family antitoxin [Trinickia mobilis]|uniref:type II toxin-antitoxin system Phd/YefM family antitoxin n=1 Tax=Trinickia mobilis TaxID=2816356 RepID=UPI001A8CED39|nr:prevent-host-death protein [Trinickia mobilis]
MRSVEISEISHLSQLIDELERVDGKVLLLRDGQPAAILVSMKAGPGKRIGVAKGAFELPDIDKNDDDMPGIW